MLIACLILFYGKAWSLLMSHPVRYNRKINDIELSEILEHTASLHPEHLRKVLFNNALVCDGSGEYINMERASRIFSYLLRTHCSNRFLSRCLSSFLFWCLDYILTLFTCIIKERERENTMVLGVAENQT